MTPLEKFKKLAKKYELVQSERLTLLYEDGRVWVSTIATSTIAISYKGNFKGGKL